MNPFQITQQLVWALAPANLKWPGAGGEPVFGRVGVVSMEGALSSLDAVGPFALIRPTGEKLHEEHPDIVEEARWTVAFFALAANDQAGGAAVVGGSRSAVTSSRGRGLLEIEPIALAAILAGVGVHGRPRGTTAPMVVPGTMRGLLAQRAFEIVARRIPTSPTYTPLTRLTSSVAGANVNLGWVYPTNRWDLVAPVVRRIAGAVAPATPAGGAGVPVVGLAGGVVDAPGPGTWSYSIFAGYDSTRNPVSGARDPSNPITDYATSLKTTVVV